MYEASYNKVVLSNVFFNLLPIKKIVYGSNVVTIICSTQPWRGVDG